MILFSGIKLRHVFRYKLKIIIRRAASIVFSAAYRIASILSKQRHFSVENIIKILVAKIFLF